jgi:hypothetical protein
VSDQFTHNLAGPIAVGDVYVWEPLSRTAREVVVVTAVKPDWIETADYHTGERCWNSEDRLREACVRVPMIPLEPGDT